MNTKRQLEFSHTIFNVKLVIEFKPSIYKLNFVKLLKLTKKILMPQVKTLTL